MSELINTNDNRATIRWKLLTGASALALTVYVSSANTARAEDTDHPLLWIELGGQMEMLQGTSTKFTAPFMFLTPEPDSYSDDIFTRGQKPIRYAFGLEGGLVFQPANSDWKFSAAFLYGRAHVKSHIHQQGAQHYGYKYYSYTRNHIGNHGHQKPLYVAAFADSVAQYHEQHAVLDFSAGKDVGMGMLGSNGSSTINVGVRFAQFSQGGHVSNSARPSITNVFFKSGILYWPWPQFRQFNQTGQVERRFDGVGPSLSWQASAALAGNKQDGELTFDWGINGAVLFGRQRAKVHHTTREHELQQTYYTSSGIRYRSGAIYPLIYQHPHNSTRSRRVTVPNIGGSIGISVKWPNAKVSIGYRYDDFLNAMDTGIDTAKKSNLTFNGPYASISIGLGN